MSEPAKDFLIIILLLLGMLAAIALIVLTMPKTESPLPRHIYTGPRYLIAVSGSTTALYTNVQEGVWIRFRQFPKDL